MDQVRQLRKQRFTQPIGRVGARSAAASRWRLSRIHWVKILGLILGTAGIWFLLGSGYFTINTIDIRGSLNDAVAQELQSLRGKNSIFLSTSSFERLLPKRQSSLKALRIVKGFPDTLKIDVSVREPKLVWKTGEKSYFVDGDGVLFTLEGISSSQDTNVLPVVTDTRSQSVELGLVLVPHRFVSFVADVPSHLHDATGLAISSITVGETTRNIDVATDANFTIKFDTTRNLDPQLTALALILSKYRSDIHQYVDLRVEGRVFYQ